MATHGVFVTYEVARVSTTLSEVSDSSLLQSSSSNSTFIMLYLYLDMDVDYLAVDEMINISKLFDYNCMLSIGANI
jgi:hypothetical protein